MIKLLIAILFPVFCFAQNLDLKNSSLPLNLLKNADFEKGLADWTKSGAGATWTRETTNELFGQASGKFNASANADYIQTSLYAVPLGMQGRNCEASLYYKVTDANYTLQALDESSNILNSVVLTAVTTSTPASIVFPCGTGSLRLKILAGADGADLVIDKVQLGELVLKELAVGYVPKQYDLTVTGTNWTTNRAIGIPYKTIDGTWRLRLNIKGSISVATNSFTLSLSNVVFKNNQRQAVTCFSQTSGTTNVTCYASPNTDDIVLASSANLDDPIYSGDVELESKPTWADDYSIPVYRPDVIAWRVDANISGSNISLGTVSINSYVAPDNASLTMTKNTGSIDVQIPCSSTNASSGLTCSAGNEQSGVVFNLPRAGSVLACTDYSVAYGVHNTSGAFIADTFQIVETANNSQTIIQEGKSRVSGSVNYEGGASPQSSTLPFRLCGTFYFASAGQKTLRLMFESNQNYGGATVQNHLLIGDASAGDGQRDIHWEVYPIDQSIPAPLLVGSVTSNSSGLLRTESAAFNCQSSSTVSGQTGSWISTIGNISSGGCTLTLVAGIFSATPWCTVSNNGTGIGYFAQVNPGSATSVLVKGTYWNGSTVTNDTNWYGSLTCWGPR